MSKTKDDYIKLKLKLHHKGVEQLRQVCLGTGLSEVEVIMLALNHTFPHRMWKED